MSTLSDKTTGQPAPAVVRSDIMEQDPRQSIHEIGQAKQMSFALGKAEMVTIRSNSPDDGDGLQEEDEHENTLLCQGASEEIEGSSKRNPGQRLLFVSGQDRWSTFPNPACTHERDCGHNPQPRIVFNPDGAEPNQQAAESSSRSAGTTTPITDATPPQASDTDSVKVQMGSWFECGGTDELPAKVGPFVLESLSAGSSATEGPTEYRAALTFQQEIGGLEKDHLPDRTEAWLVKLASEAPTVPVPGHAPPRPIATTSKFANPEKANMVMVNNPGPERSQASGDAAIRGNFIPLSTSYRERSPSPRREQGPHGFYLQLSLTDSQMDRLTAALSTEDGDESFARGRDKQAVHNASQPKNNDRENTAPSMRSRSPAKTYQSASTPSRARSRSPVKFSSIGKAPNNQRAAQDYEFDESDTPTQSSHKSQEIRFAQDAPTTWASPTRTTGRVARGPPTPINTNIARADAKLSAQRGGRQPLVVVQHPPERERSPVRQPNQYVVADDTSSLYSQDSTGHRFPSCISPLRIQKENDPKHLSILQGYMDNRNSSRGSGTESEEPERPESTDETSSGAELQYTPLAPFLPQNIPSVRKASKTLIGENGWLENTSKPKPTEPNTSPTRGGGGFLGNLVKRAKGMIESGNDAKAQRKSRESDKSRPTSRQLAISLNPREQSLLYCEFEFILATALNDYITTQFNSGRLEADKLRKVAEDWQRKGRPKVVGFRYDMETQLDLVRMHVNDFKFYSRVAATNAILGIIDTMKANARVLRIRTYCQPDTVVAKQLLDSQSLFNILGCPEEQHIKLAEIVAFFKAAIERERLHALQQHQQVPTSAAAMAAAAAAAAPSSPMMRQSKSQGQADEWWGTGAGPARQTTSTSRSGGMMDPGGYESQDGE